MTELTNDMLDNDTISGADLKSLYPNGFIIYSEDKCRMSCDDSYVILPGQTLKSTNNKFFVIDAFDNIGNARRITANGYNYVTFPDTEQITMHKLAYANPREFRIQNITILSNKFYFKDLTFDQCKIILQKHNHFIRYIQDNLQENVELCKIAYENAFSDLPDKMRKNEEIIDLLSHNAHKLLYNFEYINPEYINYKELCVKMLTQKHEYLDTSIYKYIPYPYKIDIDILVALARNQDPVEYKYIPDEFKKHPAVLEALVNNPRTDKNIIGYFPANADKDLEFCKIIARNKKLWSYLNKPSKLRNDFHQYMINHPEIQKIMEETNPIAFEKLFPGKVKTDIIILDYIANYNAFSDKPIPKCIFTTKHYLLMAADHPSFMYIICDSIDKIPGDLLQDYDVCKKLVSKKCRLFENFPAFHDNAEIVEIAVTSEENMFKYASERLKNDLDFCKKIAEFEPRIIEHIGDQIKNNYEIVNIIVNHKEFGCWMFGFFNIQIKTNKEFCKIAVANDGETIMFLPSHLRNMPEIYSLALKSDPDCIRYLSDELRCKETLVPYVSAEDLPKYEKFFIGELGAPLNP